MNLVPCVVDWNKDGNPDLVVGDEDGILHLYLNLGMTPQEKTAAMRTKKVKVLSYEGRIKTGYSDIDVGSFAAPSVIDWDEDGEIGRASWRERV